MQTLELQSLLRVLYANFSPPNKPSLKIKLCPRPHTFTCVEDVRTHAWLKLGTQHTVVKIISVPKAVPGFNLLAKINFFNSTILEVHRD